MTLSDLAPLTVSMMVFRLGDVRCGRYIVDGSFTIRDVFVRVQFDSPSEREEGVRVSLSHNSQQQTHTITSGTRTTGYKCHEISWPGGDPITTIKMMRTTIYM